VRDSLGSTILGRLGHTGRGRLAPSSGRAKQREGVRLIVELGVDVNGVVPGQVLTERAAQCRWRVRARNGQAPPRLGADPTLRDPTFHSTPIGWPSTTSNAPSSTTCLTFATIIDAVRCDGVERVAALLQQDPSLSNAKDEDGNPLASYLHPEMARLEEMLGILVAHGVPLNTRNVDGATLLDRGAGTGMDRFCERAQAVRCRSGGELTAGA